VDADTLDMIRLTPDEAWQVITHSHTGILTTLRRDGAPVSLPVWFVVDGNTVAVTTPSGTTKVARIRHDPRAAFLAESGKRWEELRAVHLTGHVEIVDDPEAMARIDKAITAKYAEYRPQSAVLPEKMQALYARQTFLRFVPDERILSWDNARIAMRRP
jgi:PPOX class probable F420-dependent enzyme